MPDERDRLRLRVHDGDDVGEQDFRCRGQLVLSEARRLPVTAKVGGEDVPTAVSFIGRGLWVPRPAVGQTSLSTSAASREIDHRIGPGS